MAITLVSGSNSLNSIQAAGTSIAVGPVTTGSGGVGSLTVLFVTCSVGGPTLDNVQDDVGNFATQVGFFNCTLQAQLLYVLVIENTEGGSRTYTATYTGSIGDRSIHCATFEGLENNGTCFGDISSGTQGNAAQVVTGSITPTKNDSLVVGFMSDTSGETHDLDAGFTELTDTVVGYNTRTCYQVQTTAASAQASWTHTNASDYGGLIAWFFPPQNIIPAPVAHGPIDNVWAPMMDANF